MITIKCECEYCIQNDNGHWWCRRFSDFIDAENREMCRQHPIATPSGDE